MCRTLAILTTFLLTCTASHIEAQTDIFGGILSTTTWTSAGSPYIIHGDISIQSGAILTIEPGVHVQISGQDITISGKDISLTEIIIQDGASLVAEGLQADSILFTLTPNSQENDMWYGIEATSGSSINIQYTSITDTHTALLIGQVNPSNIDHCEISRISNLGLVIEGSSSTMLTLNNLSILQ